MGKASGLPAERRQRLTELKRKLPKKGCNTAKQRRKTDFRNVQYTHISRGRTKTDPLPSIDGYSKKREEKVRRYFGASSRNAAFFSLRKVGGRRGRLSTFVCAKAGAQRREDERHRTEKGIRKITFREVPRRGFPRKAGGVKSLPGGFFRRACRENPEKSPFKAENHRQSAQSDVYKMNTIYKS